MSHYLSKTGWNPNSSAPAPDPIIPDLSLCTVRWPFSGSLLRDQVTNLVTLNTPLLSLILQVKLPMGQDGLSKELAGGWGGSSTSSPSPAATGCPAPASLPVPWPFHLQGQQWPSSLPHMHLTLTGLPWWLSGKESAWNTGDVGDPGSIPGLGRCPGEGNGNPLQYSCLGNPMDRGAWRATAHGVAKSQTWLSTHAYTLCFSLPLLSTLVMTRGTLDNPEQSLHLQILHLIHL